MPFLLILPVAEVAVVDVDFGVDFIFGLPEGFFKIDETGRAGVGPISTVS